MNLDTTVGKSIKALLWVVAAAVLTAVGSFLTNHPAAFNPIVVGVVNVVLVAAKNFVDPHVKNI